jgi:hypothetical protein
VEREAERERGERERGEEIEGAVTSVAHGRDDSRPSRSQRTKKTIGWISVSASAA